jgi:hypothetical protein
MRFGRLVAAALFAASSMVLEAQDVPEAPAGEPDRSAKWSLAAGYGFTVQLNRGRSDEQLFLFEPGVAFPLSRRFELVVEGHFARFFTPEGYMVGLMPLGGRFFFGSGRARPYVSIGAGFGWTDLEGLDEIDRRFNFLLQGSVGVRGKQSDGSAWTLEVRFGHVSNAGTVRPNLGLNAILFLAGWRFR